jgi:DNA-binding NtrC family response regulator
MTGEGVAARIVVVDDDPIVATILARGLTNAGYDVRTFGSPVEAMAHLDAEPVDLVISDVHMPQMSGLDMIAAFRVKHADVPVVFITGAPRVEDSTRAIELGAFRYLTKPIDAAQATAVVREALSSAQKPAS